MDEIKLFEELQPQPPSDIPRAREAIRARLTTVMSGPPEPARHRAGRFALAGAGAVALTAALVVGLTAITGSGPAQGTRSPLGSDSGHAAHARLAAWTVTKLADGNISVTVNQFRDPAGLQSTLRADGVPASVTYNTQQNPACQPYPAGTLGPPGGPVTSLLKRVFPKPYEGLPTSPPAHARVASGPPPSTPAANSVVIVIDPSALPGNSGVQLAADYAATAFLLPRVVYASAQCTGS